MVIEIKRNLLRKEVERQVSNLIFEAANHARYDIFVDIDKQMWEEESAFLHPEDRLVLERGFKKWLTQKKVDVVVAFEPEDDEFELDEAFKYLKQPLKVLLENSDNDAHFLDALLKHFSKRGKKIRGFKEHLFLEYANAGGKSNVEHFVKGELSKFYVLPKPPERYLRLFVLVDSDKEFLGDEKPAIKKLKTYLESLSIPHHILTKREMENYLPDEAIAALEGNQDFVQAYLRLTPEQKDYFDLQNGFPDKKRSQLEREKGDAFRLLYDSVSEGDWQIFRKQNFEVPHFKNEFPKRFGAAEVTQDTLQARVAHQENPNELKDLLDAITRCL